jgi:hypothetical protein
MNRLTNATNRLKESLTDPDGFFNKYFIDPLALATFGYLAMKTLHFNSEAALDFSSALFLATASIDGLSKYANFLDNRLIRDLIARPLLTTLIIAYGHSTNDPAYLGLVYGLSIAAIHAPEIVESVYHLIQSVVEHYRK